MTRPAAFSRAAPSCAVEPARPLAHLSVPGRRKLAIVGISHSYTSSSSLLVSTWATPKTPDRIFAPHRPYQISPLTSPVGDQRFAGAMSARFGFPVGMGGKEPSAGLKVRPLPVEARPRTRMRLGAIPIRCIPAPRPPFRRRRLSPGCGRTRTPNARRAGHGSRQALAHWWAPPISHGKGRNEINPFTLSRGDIDFFFSFDYVLKISRLAGSRILRGPFVGATCY
jgi:hypothetical protein